MFSRTPSAGKINSCERSALSDRMPAASASRGVPVLTGLPSQKTWPLAGFEAAEGAQRLALAVALGAGETEDLAAVDVEGDVVEARAAEARGPERDVGGLDVGGRLAGYSASIGRPTISAMRSPSDRLALTS